MSVQGVRQGLPLQGVQPLGDGPVGQQRIESVAGAGEHVQFGRDTGAQQTERVVDGLVTEGIDLRAGYQSRWKTF